MTQPNSTPDYIGKLQWKDEDEENGRAMGPVWINGAPREWLYKSQAEQLAKELGLTFEEV